MRDGMMDPFGGLGTRIVVLVPETLAIKVCVDGGRSKQRQHHVSHRINRKRPATNHNSKAGHDWRKDAEYRMVDPNSVIVQVSVDGVVEVVWSYFGNSIKMADGMKTRLTPTIMVFVSHSISPVDVSTLPVTINPINTSVNFQLAADGSLRVLLSNGPAAETLTFCRYSSTMASMSVLLSSSLSVFSGLARAMHSISET